MTFCTRFQVKNCAELTNKKTRRAVSVSAPSKFWYKKKRAEALFNLLQIEPEIAQKVESYHALILYRFYSK